ncbi:MAG: hypothetical protein P8Y70_05145 [Candidatus Lokiarchaeota archaeon]
MRKHYKNEKLMKFLVIIGALVGLAYLISSFFKLGQDWGIIQGIQVLDPIIIFIIGLIVVVLTLLTAIKPRQPLPFHWLVLFILGILLVIFGAGIWAGVLVVIAALIGLIEDL